MSKLGFEVEAERQAVTDGPHKNYKPSDDQQYNYMAQVFLVLVQGWPTDLGRMSFAHGRSDLGCPLRYHLDLYQYVHTLRLPMEITSVRCHQTIVL